MNKDARTPSLLYKSIRVDEYEALIRKLDATQKECIRIVETYKATVGPLRDENARLQRKLANIQATINQFKR